MLLKFTLKLKRKVSESVTNQVVILFFPFTHEFGIKSSKVETYDSGI